MSQRRINVFPSFVKGGRHLLAHHWQNTHFFKVVDTRDLRRGSQDQILRQSQNQTRRRSSQGQTGFQETNRSCWCNFYCSSSSPPCTGLYNLKICQQALAKVRSVQLEPGQNISVYRYLSADDQMKCSRVQAMMYLFDTTQLCLNQTFPVDS